MIDSGIREKHAVTHKQTNTHTHTQKTEFGTVPESRGIIPDACIESIEPDCWRSHSQILKKKQLAPCVAKTENRASGAVAVTVWKEEEYRDSDSEIRDSDIRDSIQVYTHTHTHTHTHTQTNTYTR